MKDQKILIEALEHWIEYILSWAEDDKVAAQLREADSLLQRVKAQKSEFTV